MSRITCLIIFSGSSALSIKSLRVARTNVETRSSNAMTDSFLSFSSVAPSDSFHVSGAERRTPDILGACLETTRPAPFQAQYQYSARPQCAQPELPQPPPAPPPAQYPIPYVSICSWLRSYFPTRPFALARMGTGAF